jgi:hypothetical protein
VHGISGGLGSKCNNCLYRGHNCGARFAVTVFSGDVRLPHDWNYKDSGVHAELRTTVTMAH